ncbi:hypothetical protein OGZ37_06845 [Lactococcus lactis]|uniref:hypothetical protein n=1 Tax=Lactococcus lactis TaxID=1358 RepID=UPI002418262D|nr:hypothetical protein [Lactococcus lactis]MDG4966293.1 hypothetical protein [Lactococcus lactis]
MKFEFLITTDTIISILALLLAIGSALYTWNSNRYSVSLSDISNETKRGQLFFEFTLTNTSSRPLRLKKLSLIRDDSIIKDNKFDVVAHDNKVDLELAEAYEKENIDPLTGSMHSINPHFIGRNYSDDDFSNNFTKEVFLLPSESRTFSYFVDVLPTTIEISTNKHIRLFKKTKSFSAKSY